MTNEQLDRLKRMAVNAGSEECVTTGDGELTRDLFFDNETLDRYTRAVLLEAAKAAETAYTTSRLPTIDAVLYAIRNLYREQA